MSTARWRTGCCLLGLSVLVGGCKTTKPYDLQVKLSDAVVRSGEPVEVDVVGVSQLNFARWNHLNINEYWQGVNSLRQDVISTPSAKLLRLSAANPTASLGRDDPIWDKWFDEQDVYAVFIICNVPRMSQPAPGEEDGRRKVLYKRRSTKRPSDLRLEVTPAGLIYQQSE